MPKCDFNSNFIESALRHGSCKFAAYLQKTFSKEHLWVGHGVRVQPGSWDPGPWDPLKFKSGTPGSLQSLKVGPLHISLMNSFFSEYFMVFLFSCLF